MAKGYSARRGFSNGSGQMLKQQQIPHAAPHIAGFKPGLLQGGQDLFRFFLRHRKLLFKMGQIFANFTLSYAAI